MYFVIVSVTQLTIYQYSQNRVERTAIQNYEFLIEIFSWIVGRCLGLFKNKLILKAEILK